MLCKLYFKTNKLFNYINNNTSYDIFICFLYVSLILKPKINSSSVPKYHGDVMTRCQEGDYSAINEPGVKVKLTCIPYNSSSE